MPLSRLESTLSSDALASVDTSLGVSIGGTAHGRISTTTDKDWIAVDLIAGRSYTFAMVGIGASRLTDAFLSLIDSNGSTVLASNDDGLPNNNAIVHFTASSSGRYFLEAAGAKAVGDYGVSASLGGKASFDREMITGSILSNLSWSATAGSGVNLTYGFRDTYSGSNPNFSHLSESQKTAVRAVLAYFHEITGLSFTEVNPGGFTNNATMMFSNYSANDGAAAYAYFPGQTSSASAAGDVWINTNSPETMNTDPAVFLNGTLMHEVGHAMGLSHPGSYAAAAGLSITYSGNAQFVQDSNQYTVMSYFDADRTGGATVGPGTLMLHDIEALQIKYGANMHTRAGATVYGDGSTAGALYDFAANPNAVFTIWDGGGIDELASTRFAGDQVISLQEGGFSSLRGQSNNVSVAYGAVIENASGGRGSDRIIGNAAANLLHGGEGDDRLIGFAGHDRLYGGAGSDTLEGGLGNDSLYGGEAGDGPSVFETVATDFSAAATLSLKNAALFPTGSFTVEMIWQQNDLADPHYSLDIGNLSFYRYDTGKVALMFWGAPEESWNYNSVPLALTDGAAHRISISYDDGDGMCRIYLDGAESWAHGFTPGTRALPAIGNIVLDDDASVGDLRIFDHVRSADQIWDMAWKPLTAPESESGLVQYWVGDGSGHLVSALPGQADLISKGTTTADQAVFGSADLGDVMMGGIGNDCYYVSNSADQVIEVAKQGFDKVFTTVDYALAEGSSVEVLISKAKGSGLHLSGNSFNNTLRSGGAADSMAGGLGNDTYFVNQWADVVLEESGQGYDTVIAARSYALAAGASIEVLRSGSAKGLSLTGNALNNKIIGGAGADTLTGGAGCDRLDGGVGDAADVFVFKDISDSVVGTARDFITGFVSGQDRVDMSGIDADIGQAGDQAFAFAGRIATAHAIWYQVMGPNLRFSADVDGDAVADFELALLSVDTVTAADFIL